MMKWIFGLGREVEQPFPENGEVFFGFENYGNTCYCNSVLQALYFCQAFRQQLLQYRPPFVGEDRQEGDPSPLSVDFSALGLVDSVAQSANLLYRTTMNILSGTPSPIPGPPGAPDASKRAEIPSLITPTSHTSRDSGDDKILDRATLSPGLNPLSPGLNHIASSASPAAPACTSPVSLPSPDPVHKSAIPTADSATLLDTLRELFLLIQNQKKRSGILGPKAFITRLRAQHGRPLSPSPDPWLPTLILVIILVCIETFRSYVQQDAHEFLNFLINDLADTVLKQTGRPRGTKSWIHALFEGELSNETRCLACENVGLICIANKGWRIVSPLPQGECPSIISGAVLVMPPIPYHTIPYHTIPSHPIPYHTIPYHPLFWIGYTSTRKLPRSIH